tara:strand:- start:176 stop:574 length:399 start_codon:yes stop_codon:yes gene_type:complete
MPGLSPKLPLIKNANDGYASNKTIRSLARQNLKMLILTSPGERVMVPNFGVGIRRYLFENISQSTFSRIEAAIKSQVSIYLPYVNILQINIVPGFNDTELLANNQFDTNSISLQIKYVITTIRTGDTLTMSI